MLVQHEKPLIIPVNMNNTDIVFPRASATCVAEFVSLTETVAVPYTGILHNCVKTVETSQWSLTQLGTNTTVLESAMC